MTRQWLLSHNASVTAADDLTMGSLYSKLCAELCSKSSTHEGGHTILNHNTVGGEVDGSNPSNPRAAAAEAAERRAKVVKIFPNHVKL